MALYEAKGLEPGIDGILGLSNRHDKTKKSLNFIQSLKDNGVISQAMISFSVSNQGSYALFGDFNTSQVVGGLSGLHSLKTYAYLPEFAAAQKNWALEGQNMLYGDAMLGPDASFPAIIDTGSSTLGVPSALFDAAKDQW